MATQVASVIELASQVAQDPNLQNQLKSDPVGTLATLAQPLDTDVWIYRMVVIVLGVVVLAAVASAIGFAAYGKDIPQLLTALGSASIGALAGLLAPSPTGKK